MPANDSNVRNENDFSVADDSYASVNDAATNAAHGVGGTTTASETFDRVGSAASEFNDARAEPLGSGSQGNLNSADDAAAIENIDNSPMSWLVPLMILAALIILGYSLCSKASTVSSISPYAATVGERV